MVSKVQPPVKVQQCLFGYEDGHRLLESSLKINNEAESTLLRLSDLAPGISELQNKSYWTGIPLPSINQYALLRTWSAPEMPRPGCVWTHALLIGFADIARFVDLAILKKYLVKPEIELKYEKYSQPILIDTKIISSSESSFSYPLSNDNLLEVIRAVYKSTKQSYLFAENNEFDTAIFRVWSQQWPRLRRSFSFRTTGSLYEKPTIGVHFDLRVLPQSDNYTLVEEKFQPSEPNSWEAATIKDILNPKQTEFRRFLWRYGSDIHKGRERFSFLADLYVTTLRNPLDTKKHATILLKVAEALPDLEDGKVLKSDLVDGELNTYSLIPTIDPLEILKFFIWNPQIKGLPIPKASTIQYLKKFWATRSEEILVLAEQAIKKKSILRENILTQLLEVINTQSFLEITHEQPYLRYSLITERPSLLNSDKLLSVGQPELSKLLALIPDNQQLAGKIIERLIYLNDQYVAEEMFSRFPGIVTRSVIDSINITPSTRNKALPRIWLRIITKSETEFLRSGYIENLLSMSTLADFAKELGYKNNKVLNVGPIPWASALVKAKDDMPVKTRDKFYAFLLMLAINKPQHGCEPIFEHTFEYVHTALANGNLSNDALSLITEYLPNVHWWKQWDLCHRLRVAIVNTYVNNDLDQESFKRLTNNKELADSLIDLANETSLGQRFLKKNNF